MFDIFSKHSMKIKTVICIALFITNKPVNNKCYSSTRAHRKVTLTRFSLLFDEIICVLSKCVKDNFIGRQKQEPFNKAYE